MMRNKAFGTIVLCLVALLIPFRLGWIDTPSLHNPFAPVPGEVNYKAGTLEPETAPQGPIANPEAQSVTNREFVVYYIIKHYDSTCRESIEFYYDRKDDLLPYFLYTGEYCDRLDEIAELVNEHNLISSIKRLEVGGHGYSPYRLFVEKRLGDSWRDVNIELLRQLTKRAQPFKTDGLHITFVEKPPQA